MGAPLDLAWLTERPIAHRGLHDLAARRPENSLAAFEAAASHGYAIECDVRLSADGVPVVFHDGDLSRLCGTEGRLSERTAAEIGALRLLGTEETPPTLAAMLELLRGRVPVVAELKGTDPKSDEGFVTALAPVLKEYRGSVALMSFNGWLVEAAIRTFGDRLPVGLTAEGTREETLEEHRALFALGCRFVSYNVHHLANAFVREVRAEHGCPVISWTVRGPADEALSRLHADQITFESYLPQ